jgi:hypothetical protein
MGSRETLRRFRVYRDARFRAAMPAPILVLPDDVRHPYAVAMESVHLAPNTQMNLYGSKDTRQDPVGGPPHPHLPQRQIDWQRLQINPLQPPPNDHVCILRRSGGD